MPHHTTLPAHVRHGFPSPPDESLDTGHNLGRLTVDVDGQRFRVRTAQLSTPWLPDTPSNRHLTVVWLRLRRDAHDKPCLTWQELAPLVGSANRQAASQPREDFRQCGEDFRAFVLRKRKGDATVVEAVLVALLQTPFAGPTELLARVQKRLGRNDLDAANIESALEHISCVPVLRTLRRQLEAGQVHDQEAWRWTEFLETRSLPAPPASRLERA
jgi:hypothetical protein